MMSISRDPQAITVQIDPQTHGITRVFVGCSFLSLDGKIMLHGEENQKWQFQEVGKQVVLL